jgi:hypothetical protein
MILFGESLEEAGIANVNVLFWHLPVGTEKTHEKVELVYSVSQ